MFLGFYTNNPACPAHWAICFECLLFYWKGIVDMQMSLLFFGGGTRLGTQPVRGYWFYILGMKTVSLSSINRSRGQFDLWLQYKDLCRNFGSHWTYFCQSRVTISVFAGSMQTWNNLKFRLLFLIWKDRLVKVLWIYSGLFCRQFRSLIWDYACLVLRTGGPRWKWSISEVFCIFLLGTSSASLPWNTSQEQGSLPQ